MNTKFESIELMIIDKIKRQKQRVEERRIMLHFQGKIMRDKYMCKTKYKDYIHYFEKQIEILTTPKVKDSVGLDNFINSLLSNNTLNPPIDLSAFDTKKEIEVYKEMLIEFKQNYELVKSISEPEKFEDDIYSFVLDDVEAIECPVCYEVSAYEGIFCCKHSICASCNEKLKVDICPICRTDSILRRFQL